MARESLAAWPMVVAQKVEGNHRHKMDGPADQSQTREDLDRRDVAGALKAVDHPREDHHQSSPVRPPMNDETAGETAGETVGGKV